MSTYRYFCRLQSEVTGRFEGLWASSEPVGGDSGEGAHTHEGVRGQAAHIMQHVIQLGNPQLSQDFLSLHD